MELIKNEKHYETIHSIIEIKEHKYFFGIMNVLFGKRICAGVYGEGWVSLDWCCGDDLVLLAKVYSCMIKHFERWDGKKELFAGLPSRSNIKPLNRDKEFLEKVIKVIPEFKIIDYVQHN